jgi:hypothetical protein
MRAVPAEPKALTLGRALDVAHAGVMLATSRTRIGCREITIETEAIREAARTFEDQTAHHNVPRPLRLPVPVTVDGGRMGGRGL